MERLSNECDRLPTEAFLNEGIALLIGQIIFNIFNKSPKGLDEWENLLNKRYRTKLEQIVEEDSEYECNFPSFINNLRGYIEKFYMSFITTLHTHQSIEYLSRLYSSTDISPDEEQIRLFESMISNQTHRNIALYIYYLSKSIIASNKTTLFTFNRHESVWLESGTEFVTLKFEDIHVLLEKEICKAASMFRETHDDSLRDKMEERFRSIEKLKKYISNRSTVSKVYQYVCDFTRDHSINSKWDSYPNYTGCKNGTIICHGSHVTFRVALPEDYIKKRISASYGLTNEVNRTILDDWFAKLFPDVELRRYISKLISSLLIDGNADKSIYFLSGETGNNSKSTFINAIHNCMGVDNYSKKVPANLLTRPLNSAHQANSAMCDLAESRLVTFDEPEAQEEFIASNVKSVTGNDGSSSRRLHKEAKSMQIKSIIISGMNRVPPFRDPDNACKSRVVIIPFITRWSDKAPKSESQQVADRHYKCDPDFISKISNLNDEILDLMVRYYPFWYTERLVNVPKAIKKALKKYWEDTDYYEDWIKKSFVNVPNTTAEYNLEDTYSDFCTFFIKSNPKKVLPDLKTYKHHMTLLFGVRYTVRCKRWKDWEYKIPVT